MPNDRIRRIRIMFDKFIKKKKDEEVNTNNNKEKIDELIHEYIGEQSKYGRCSADWRKARKEVQADEKMRQELVEKLQSLK